jgi:multidrug efflux pump subunit AcrA (membrane-fusion protein)
MIVAPAFRPAGGLRSCRARDAHHVSRYLWLCVLLALGGAAYWYYANNFRAPAPVATAPAAAAIPVIATTAESQNVSDNLTGLGTVQAFNRVTVHVRVDGELQDIRFTEGRFVQAGDVLAQIDPPVPCGARSGQGEEGPGPSASDLGAEGFGPRQNPHR